MAFLDTVAKWSGPSPLSCAIWGFCDIVRKWMGGGSGGWRVEAVLIRKIYFWESTRREIREKNPSCGIVTFCGRKEGISQSAMDGSHKKDKEGSRDQTNIL